MPPEPHPGGRTRPQVEAMGELIRTLAVESQRLAQAFADGQHLHATDMEALVHVLEAERLDEPLTPGQLAVALGLSTSATTSVIDRMEGHGHVRRERDGHDRRRVNLRVDEAALAVAGEFFGPLTRRSSDVLAPFSDDDLDTAALVIQALTGAIRDHRRQLAEEPAPEG